MSTTPAVSTANPVERTGTSQAEPAKQIVVAATFTAEPLGPALDLLVGELQITASVDFAPYNQAFQQLLDPHSLLAQNQSGLNVILIRLEDWLRPHGTAEKATPLPLVEKRPALERFAQELLAAVREAAGRSKTPYLVCLCPASPETNAQAEYGPYLAQMETSLAAGLDQINGVYAFTSAQISRLYPVGEYYQPHGDELGHIPYTPAYYAALGAFIARQVYALFGKTYKAIVLDCDQTLWQGVCGEDGPTGVAITPPFRALQAFVAAQHQAGMLLCLCSKNSESDVFAVFDHHPDMPLQREHLVAWKINWLPKSENVRALADELQLGLDSFIFVDDNPLEIAEVQAGAPAVLTVLLPAEASQIPHFLEHIWAFDHLKVTQEDRQRTFLYQQNVQRDRYRQEKVDFSAFLAGLNLQIEIQPVQPEQMSRVAQLTQRTNQFNATTTRRSEAELQQLLQSDRYACTVVNVKDRFGDYGLVGVSMYRRDEQVLTVDNLLLSCRALGRGVEHRMLAQLGEVALAYGLEWVEVPCRHTERNQPVQRFLESSGAAFAQDTPTGRGYRFPAAAAAALVYQPAAQEPEPAAGETEKAHSEQPADISGRPQAARLARIAAELSDVTRIQAAIAARQRKPRPAANLPAYVPPASSTETALVESWTSILAVQPVGAQDSFFELGGNSLQATQLIARLRDAFQIDLGLQSLFENPTPAGLARYIDVLVWTSQAGPTEGAPPGENYEAGEL